MKYLRNPRKRKARAVHPLIIKVIMEKAENDAEGVVAADEVDLGVVLRKIKDVTAQGR